MSAGSKELEQTEPPATKVALKGNKLGFELKLRGQSFALSEIFDEKPLTNIEVSPTTVYFRTEQNNVYRLRFKDGKARLINANESTVIRDINQFGLSPEILKKQKLTVGDTFVYDVNFDQVRTVRTTSMISEIVATTNKIYDFEYLMGITNGRSNAIIHDFEGRLPSSKPKPFPK